MAAHVGVDTTFDLTTPVGGYVHEAESERTIDNVTIRDENGDTVVSRPRKRIVDAQSIKGKGDANLAAVVAGAFTLGTLRVISAKQTETAEDFPDFEIEGKVFSNMA